MAYERLVKKLTKENLWMYILRILSEGPTYAYEIKKELRERFRISPATITVYVVLYKMRREGLIKVKAGRPLGRPDRVYYEMTKKGEETLARGRALLEETLRLLG